MVQQRAVRLRTLLKKICSAAVLGTALSCFSLSGAWAVSVTLLQPSAAESTLAPTRDFLVLGRLDDRKDKIYNVKIEVVRSDGTVVRTVVSDVDASGATPPSKVNRNYSFTGQNNDSGDKQGFLSLRGQADAAGAWNALLKDPPPDLVGASRKEFLDPSNKAVVNAKGEFAALVLGGVTKNLDTSYPYAGDLTEGSYKLRVSALDKSGKVAASAETALEFAPSPMVFGRFSPTASDGFPHKENLAAFARENKLKIMYDFFPGYWSRDKVFHEIKARWRVNDLVEYLYAPVSKGVIYNVNDGSATQNVEIGGMLYHNYFQDGDPDHKVFLYRYDVGDTNLSYERQDGSTAAVTGTLVPFDKDGDRQPRSSGYDQLIFSRAERRGAGADTSENVLDLTGAAAPSSGLDIGVGDGVYVKPGQTLSLYGVAAPLSTDQVAANPDGSYSVRSRLSKIVYSITKPDGTQLSTTRDVSLKRIYAPSWESPSLYEFKNDFGADLLDQKGKYDIVAQGYTSQGTPAADSSQRFKVVVSDLGVDMPKSTTLTRNQESVARRLYDLELDNLLAPQSWNDYSALSGSASLPRALTSLEGQPLLKPSSTSPYDWLQLDIPKERKNAWWGSYVYSKTNVSGGRKDDYSVQSNGFSLGYRRQMNAATEGGVVLSYAKPELTQSSNSATGKELYVGLYGQHRFGDGFAGRIWLGMGKQDYGTEAAINKSLQGSLDGTTREISLEVDKSFQLGSDMLIRPALGFSYNRINQDSLDGAIFGSTDWTGERTYNSTLLRLGVYLDRYSPSSRWYARAFYNHRLGGDSLSHLGAAFYSSGRNLGSLSALMNEDSFSVGVGLELKLNKQADNLCFLDYQGEFSSKVDAHKMRAGYKMLF